MDKPACDPELVYLDVRKLARLRIQRGLSVSALKVALDKLDKYVSRVSPNSVDTALKGGGIRPGTAKSIADFFEVDVLDLLDPRDAHYEPPLPKIPSVPWEWEIDKSQPPRSQFTSNGLWMTVCRLKHRHTRNQLARGKFYLLSGLAAAELPHKQEHLRRHANVCQHLGRHPQIAENITSAPTANDLGWWVVDQWVAGKSLAEYLGSPIETAADQITQREVPSWPHDQLPRLMQQVAAGLAILHNKGVIMRELAPSRVWIAEADGQPMLTDFELAKLLTGEPTVRPDESWPDDPYRAPEVESGEVSFRSDLYSWARILVHAACGFLPVYGQEAAALDSAGLPKRVWAIARSCLDLDAANRPADVSQLQSTIRNWK